MGLGEQRLSPFFMQFYGIIVVYYYIERSVEMLTPQQEAGIRMMFDGKMTQKAIAKELGITEQAIIYWKKSDEFKAEQLKYERRQLKKLVPKAIRTMEKLLDAKSELVRYNAASDILDRAGHKAVEEQKLEVTNPITIVDDIK